MKREPYIFIPIGSYEQHGPHLPPNTDYLIAKSLTHQIAQDFKGAESEGIKIGISPEHLGFKKTMTITPLQMKTKIKNIITNHSDYKKYIIINAHGGNKQVLNSISESYKGNLLVLHTFSVIKEELQTKRTSKLGGICHAGEFETSLMLSLYPELVEMANLKESDSTYVPKLDPNYKGERISNWKTCDLSKSGILGDPFYASAEKGKYWFNCLLEKFTSLIINFLDVNIEY